MKYLSDIEIAQSCKMKPILEIAKKCGFSSVEYFVREFVEKEKISPKDYRTAHRH